MDGRKFRPSFTYEDLRGGGNMKILRSEKGQSMVEFAFTIIFLLFFLMGIMELSWLMGNKLLATHASREGARYAAVHHVDDKGSWTNTENRVTSSLLVKTGAVITVSTSGDAVIVQVSQNINHLTGFIPSSVIANPFPINAKTTMKQE